MDSNTSIWWIRRDLRLNDNPALSAAARYSNVVPLFILDDQILNSRYAGEKRAGFLFEGLQTLDEQLWERGGRLIVRRGPPEEALRSVLQETSSVKIFAEADFSPLAQRRDQSLIKTLPVSFVGQPTAIHPELVRKRDGEPYSRFSAFARRWTELVTEPFEILPAPASVSVPAIDSLAIPDPPALTWTTASPAGEQAGLRRLQRFVEGSSAPVFRYARDRDRLDLGGTSRLSPYLRFGMISSRQAMSEAMNAIQRAGSDSKRGGPEKWLSELIWREFYASLLFHFPRVRIEEFNHRYREIEWINDEEDFEAWKEGRTGYPIVDACMRQLLSEGWMHNRGRMITASFLIKHLLVDWRLGEQHFMQHLIDGDPASNNGNWQWVAGTGAEAAPYFRILNPVLQGQRHDPDGDFIRTWVPELTDLPGEAIHEPWKHRQRDQGPGSPLPDADYPEPIVEHRFARQRALDAYHHASRL